MNKRVREIVKMHLDTGLICKNTPISIIDLSAGKRVDVCAGSRWITKYLEREVGAYKLSERNGLCIMVKSQEEPEVENPYSKKEAQDPDELVSDLVEKAQMQQTLHDVLRMLDGWEYPSRHIDDAEENLRCAIRELRDEIEKIQNVMTGEANKEKEQMSREKLKKARKEAGLTQQQMADKLDISIVYYQKIEQGSRTGDFTLWDTLEDITGVHQRILREIEDNHPGKESNP